MPFMTRRCGLLGRPVAGRSGGSNGASRSHSASVSSWRRTVILNCTQSDHPLNTRPSPRSLGLSFASWTLDRLTAYLNEQKGIAIKRTRIDELLLAEGLRWRSQETWFGERVDPAFAEKRGPSSRSTPPRLRVV